MAKVPLSDVSSSRQYKKEVAKTNLAIEFFHASILSYPDLYDQNEGDECILTAVINDQERG